MQSGAALLAATPAQRKAKVDRTLRYRMRAVGQRLTDSKSVTRCGRWLAGYGDSASVSLRVNHPIGGTPRAYFAGLYRCSSVWECPVCAPRIQRGRADEVQELNKRHQAAGGGMYLVTLTIPHDQGDRLRPLRKHVSRSWTRAVNGKPWQRWKSALGIIGQVRALEVTHGPNGWHPHLHLALYTSTPAAARALVAFRTWLRARWEKFVTQPTADGRKFRAPAWRHGVKVSRLRAAEYLTKMGLAAWELTSSSTKAGRPGHRTPFQILRDVALGVDRERQRADSILWRVWAHAMAGARQLTYSPGLRKRYRLGEPLEDAQLPDSQGELEVTGAGDGSELIATFTRSEWRDILRARNSVALRLRLLAVIDLERDLWSDAVVKVVEESRGIFVPF
jgi:hypothetical protein